MTVQFIMLWLAKENHHHEKSNKRHSQQRHNCWSQWNAEFCLCAQHSTKQINTSEIETGIYKQISLYLIMSQQHVINHWEVNCSPPCKKKSLFDLGDKFGFVKLIATTTQTVWGPEGPSFTWDKKLQGRWLRRPPWLPDVTCSVLHSRDNYHINLINGHPGGRERHAELKRCSSQVRIFYLVSHAGEHLSTFYIFLSKYWSWE